MGSWPNYGYPYPGIFDRLIDRGGNNQPKNYLGVNGGVGGLTPWIRLLSSVGCSGPEVSDGGLILQSNYPSDGFSSRYGTGYGSSGIVGYKFDMKTPLKVKGRPSRPSPIVSNLNIDETDVGRKNITFSITCYTMEHMDEIAKYFVEPGFNILVEWGWNTKKAQQQWAGNWENDGDGAVTPCQMARYSKWQHIKDKREASQFTYDAALGYVVDAGIKFGDNETYIFDVKLTSLGSVAEYMQSHKSTATGDTQLDSSLSFEPNEISVADDGDKTALGKSLFKQMFNDLPGHKRNQSIKSWETKPLGQVGTQKVTAFSDFDINPFGTDDNLWADQSNYINIDKTIVENFAEILKKGETIKSENSKDLKIPSDQPFISSDRFIRFELAVDILNHIPIVAPNKTKNSGLCSEGLNASRTRIDIDSTICGAFPQMFSTNPKVLYIPNPNAPLFNLAKAFGIDDNANFIDLTKLGEDGNTQNLHPIPTQGIQWTGTRSKNGANTPHAFPSQYQLTPDDNKWGCDSAMTSYKKPTRWWGWLKNLYINFDYFCSALESTNYTVKDVLLDLLNGMSAAVNSHWQFEIVEGPHPNDGTNQLRVVDKNFSDTRNIDISIIDEKKLQARGLKSPFIDFSLESTNNGAYQNNIIQKRMAGEHLNSSKKDVEPHVELGVELIRGAVFSNMTDWCNTIVSNIEYDTETKEEAASDGNQTDGTSEMGEDEKRSKNFEAFMKYAGVYLKIVDRNSAEQIIDEIDGLFINGDINIDSMFVVGTWKDTNLLKKIELINKGQNSELYGDANKKAQAQSSYGTAKINFKIHGISGFKRGDILKFDGLPRFYSEPHIWEVYSMNHTIQQDGWYSDIECLLRTNGTVTAGK